MLLQSPLAPPLAAMLGAILGSFIAALVARWPRGESVLAGRSRCEGCGQTLTPVELVPILSWLMQRGRCRRCGAPIGVDALAIELAAAAIGAIALWRLPGWPGLAAALFGWLLVPLAWLDARHFWLPRRLTAAVALAGLASGAAGLAPPLPDRLIGGAAGFGALWLVATGYRRLRGREGLGGGDPPLLGAIGLWLGWQALPFVLLGASGLGLAAALVMARRGTALAPTTRLPFGTLLALAAWPLALFVPVLALS